MNRRIAVRGIILKDNKLLCLRLKPYNDMPNQGTFWCVPGGGLDDDEPLTKGLERELIEELGVKPIIGNLLYVQQYRTDKREYLEFFFNITNTSDYLGIDLTKTSHGSIEIEELKFVDPKTTNILPTFLTKEPLSEIVLSNTPTQIFNYL